MLDGNWIKVRSTQLLASALDTLTHQPLHGRQMATKKSIKIEVLHARAYDHVEGSCLLALYALRNACKDVIHEAKGAFLAFTTGLEEGASREQFKSLMDPMLSMQEAINELKALKIT